MSRPQRDAVIATVNEHVTIECQVLHPGDSVVCDVPETFEPGDLAMALVAEDGLQLVGCVKSYNLRRPAGRRLAATDVQGECGSQQQA